MPYANFSFNNNIYDVKLPLPLHICRAESNIEGSSDEISDVSKSLVAENYYSVPK